MGASVEFDIGTLKTNVLKLPIDLDRAVTRYLSAQSPRVQDYMRSNAKWTDRTGNARQGLFAKYDNKAGVHSIDLYHTVPYGIWLEIRHSGQYAIIRPTVQAEGARIMSGLTNLMSKMGAI